MSIRQAGLPDVISQTQMDLSWDAESSLDGSGVKRYDETSAV